MAFVLGLAAATLGVADWTPTTEWGCRLQGRDGTARTLLGSISQRKSNVDGMIEQAALILQDSSAYSTGKGVRGLFLRTPRPGEYWLLLDGGKGDVMLLTLNVDGKGQAEWTAAGARGPSATGPCEHRRAKGINE